MITDSKRQINICPIYFVTDKINTVIKFEIIQKQIQDANKHWRLFLSEVPLRQADLSLVTQCLNANLETSTEINDTKK